MVKLFLATGYNSWDETTVTQVFRQPSEAEQFISELTDAKVTVLTGDTNIDAFNQYLIQQGGI
jgi:hypothetical protein